MLATVSGFFVPIGGVYTSIEDHGVSSFVTTLLLKSVPLFAANFLIIVGMYVLNDLIDTDLDKASGKKRPISSGQVTKAQARLFCDNHQYSRNNSRSIIIQSPHLNHRADNNWNRTDLFCTENLS